MIQWNLKASPLLSRTFSQTMEATPLPSPAIAGVPIFCNSTQLILSKSHRVNRIWRSFKNIVTRCCASKTLKIKQLLCDAEIAINTSKKIKKLVVSEASLLSHSIEKKSNYLDFSVTWSLTPADCNFLPGQAHVVQTIHFFRVNPSYYLHQTLFNELTIREWFTMFSNKMSYFFANQTNVFIIELDNKIFLLPSRLK